jgi:hypothetical protein
MNTELNNSPTRQYVIPVLSGDFKKKSFRRFKLPENLENTCTKATWYFYQVDLFSCGESAYPWEMHSDVHEIAPGFVMNQG